MTGIFEITGHLEGLKKEMAGCLKRWGAGMEGKREACLRAIEADYREDTADTAFVASAALGDFAYAAASGTNAEEIEERVGDILDIIFCLRYREIYEHAPDMPEDRIRYFCQILLELLPYMSTGDREIMEFAYDDFICIYVDGVDETVSTWIGSDEKAEEVYKEVLAEAPLISCAGSKDTLELFIFDTLNHLLFAVNESEDIDKKDFFLDLYRLSELFQEVLHVSAQWDEERESKGDPYYSVYKIGSWIPEFLRNPWFL